MGVGVRTVPFVKPGASHGNWELHGKRKSFLSLSLRAVPTKEMQRKLLF